jgi:putative transposase
MGTTYAEMYVHLVWTTSGRAPVIAADVERPLYAAMAEKCREFRCPPLAIGGMADHVHLLVALAPTIAVATLVKEIKGSSAHLISHRLAPDAVFRWQPGYGAFTLRKADMSTVRRYVLSQKEHHGKQTICAEWEQIDDANPRKQAMT